MREEDEKANTTHGGLLLNDNSIVNINGIRARLQVDPLTGSIRVIHLDKEQNQHVQHAAHSVDSLTVRDSGVGSAEAHTPYQRVVVAADAAITEKDSISAANFQPTFVEDGVKDDDAQSLLTRNDIGDFVAANDIHRDVAPMTDPDDIQTSPDEDPSSHLQNYGPGPLDLGAIRTDQHLDREVLETDLLEQFLSSVTHDFSFNPSVGPPQSAASTSATNIEQCLEEAPSSKPDGGAALIDSSDSITRQDVTVSPYAFFAESDLNRSADIVNKKASVPEHQIDIQSGSYENWEEYNSKAAQSFSLPQSLSENEQGKEHDNAGIAVALKSHKRLPTVKQKGGRKIRSQLPDRKLRIIRPKANIQKVLIVSVPVGSNANVNNPLKVPIEPQSNAPCSSIKQQPLPRVPLLKLIPTALTQSNISSTAGTLNLNTNILPPTASSAAIAPNINHTLVASRVPLPEVTPAKDYTNPRLRHFGPIPSSSESNLSATTAESIVRGLGTSYNLRFICPVCQHRTDQSQFYEHLLTHPTVCAVCERVLRSEEQLVEHLTVSHRVSIVRDEAGTEELRCQVCQAQFLHPANVQRHLLSQCCGSDVTVGSDVVGSSGLVYKRIGGIVSCKSNKSNKPAKKAICHKCGKSLEPKSLKAHVKSHCPADDPCRQTSPMQCSICRSLFRNLSTLRRHLAACQGRLTGQHVEHTVTCHTCLRSMSVHSLSTHRRLYCAGAKPTEQKCPHCSIALKHKHSLRNHVRWHCKKNPHAEKPSKCACGKMFKNYKAFQSHFQNHCMARGGTLGVL